MNIFLQTTYKIKYTINRNASLIFSTLIVMKIKTFVQTLSSEGLPFLNMERIEDSSAPGPISIGT